MMHFGEMNMSSSIRSTMPTFASTAGFPAASASKAAVAYDDTGDALYYSDGTNWIQLSLPSGTTNQTLRHTGSAWAATGGLLSTGTQVTVVGNNFDAHVAGAGLRAETAYLLIGDESTARTFTNGLGIKFHDSGVGHFSQKFDSSAMEMQFGPSSSVSHLQFDTNALTMRIGNGKVSIGAPAPATSGGPTLYVGGTLAFTGSSGTATSVLGRDGSGNVSNMSLSTGLSISTGTLTLGSELQGLAGLSVVGFVARTGSGTYQARTIAVSTGAASTAALAIGNADGSGGNPSISISTDNSTFKLSVEAATTANITLSGTQTVDGIALSVGNRCLVKDQTTGANNGLYVVASGAWTRDVDYNSSLKAENGLIVFVQGGITNGNKFFKVNESKPTIGTTALTFTETLTNAAGATAFTGLTDAPSSYSGEGGKFVRVNGGATALEFVASPVVSLGGLTVATQTFAVGTTGTDFGISSSGSTHTFNIPSASDTNRGLVTTGAQIFAGDKTMFGHFQVGAVTRSDTLRLANSAGAVAVLSAGGNCSFVFPAGNGTDGYFLKTDGAGTTSWSAISALSSLNGESAGTQTFATGTTGFDFGISSASGVHTFNLPSADYNVRGVVSTGAQTFGGAKTFRNNIILGFAGATTGQVDFLGSTSGTFSLKASAAAGTWTMTLPNTAGSNGQTLISNGSGVMSWMTPGDILQNGNSFGATVVIGTNDNNALSFETNGLIAATIGTDRHWTLLSQVTATTGPIDRFIIDTDSSNTPGATFGSGILFRAKSSTTASQDVGRVSGEWVVATHGSRTSNITFTGVNNAGALSDYMRVGPTAAGNAVSLRLGGGTTIYQNGSITLGTSFTLGGSSQSLIVGGSSGTININTTATGTTAIVISADGTASSSRIQIGNVAASHTSGAKHTMAIVQGYTVASGSGSLTSLYFDTIINQTGSASGPVYAIRLSPTFTGLLGQYYGLEMSYDNASAWGVYQSGANTRNLFAGFVGLGTATAPNRPLQVGSTSAITIPVGTTGQRPGTPQTGDIRINSTVGVFEYYDGSDWQATAGVSSTFLALTDTPSSFSGQALKYVRVNGGATALEFTDPPTDHGALTGLSDDDHTIYALLAGRSGGQTYTGGTASGNSLVLRSTSNATKGLISLADQGGHVTLGGGSSASELRFYEPSGGGSNYTGFVAGAMSADIMYILPTTAPSDGQFLRWNTGGTLSWATPAGGGSGDILQNGNSFGAAMTIGTNDNYALSFEQNGVTAVTIGTDKNVTFTQLGTGTNSVTNRLVLQTNTSNTVAAGFGTGVLFRAESSTTDNQDLGTIQFLWADHTHGTRTSDAVFFGVKSGSAVEMLRLKANTGTTSYFTIGGGTVQYSNAGITLASGVNFTLSGTAGLVLTSGTTAQRVDATGAIRYNSSTGRTECYTDSIWRPIDQGSIVDINAQTGTTYTLAFNDIGQLVTLDNASAITLTIPTNASVAFPIGTTINLYRKGAGTVTVGGASVTIRSADSKLKLRVQYSTASITKIGTDEWILFGDISA